MARAAGFTRAHVGALLRVAVTVGAFSYLLATTDRHAVAAALRRASPLVFLVSAAIVFSVIVLGTIRWRAVLTAYGARTLPPFRRMLRLYLVGQFYNTFLPGAVGGDVVRGLATRDACPQAAGSLTVVFVERIVGLGALLLLAGGAAFVWPPPGFGGGLTLSLLGVAGAVGALALVALGRRVGTWIGGPVGRFAALLPVLERPAPLALALLISVGGHLGSAIVGHLSLRAIGVHTDLTTSVVLVPLAMATAFFPLTVAGAGARETAFVWLYRGVGVAGADAVAASFLIFAAQLSIAALGGLLALLVPVAVADTAAAPDAVIP